MDLRFQLNEVENIFAKYFVIKDWEGIRIILATAVTHYLAGVMTWLRVIGASRSGKTEIVSAFSTHPDCAEMEALTPAAMRGGLKQGPKLFERTQGKMVVTKDAAAILTTRKDLRNEVFGLLRNAKDGKLVSDFGSSEGHLSQKVCFDWIMCSTPYIDQQRNLESLLGERFVDLRWLVEESDREEMAYQASINDETLPAIREEVKNAVHILQSPMLDGNMV